MGEGVDPSLSVQLDTGMVWKAAQAEVEELLITVTRSYTGPECPEGIFRCFEKTRSQYPKEYSVIFSFSHIKYKL